MLVEAIGGLLELWSGYVAVCLRAADGWGAIGAPPSSRTVSAHTWGTTLTGRSWREAGRNRWAGWFGGSGCSHLHTAFFNRWLSGVGEQVFLRCQRPRWKGPFADAAVWGERCWGGGGCFGAGEPDRRSSGWGYWVVPLALGAGSDWGGKVALGRGGDKQVNSKAPSFLQKESLVVSGEIIAAAGLM